ncbi:GNAT family N-acetyltransferase [Nonomuraea terrae]|uniref:GNAT family N-acetyltransferase n=1 Tax=Nonomuraea terrae TaxID=2530383 RepID=UPI0037A90E90
MFALPLTPGAELRPLEPWQAEEFLAHLDRAREHISPWVSSSFVASDLDGARAVLQGYADRRARDAGGIWGIWLEGTLCGGVMLRSFDAGLGVCEVGCWLEPAAEGRGLITGAVGRIVDWAVRTRGIQRVEWQAVAGNVRSLNVARRLGMSREGVLRQVYPRGGGRVDVEVWSLLADEWRG